MSPDQNDGKGTPFVNPEGRLNVISLQEQRVQKEKTDARRLIQTILGSSDVKDRGGIPSFTNPIDRIVFTPEQKTLVNSNPYIIEEARKEIDRLSPFGQLRAETLAIVQLGVSIVKKETEQNKEMASPLQQGESTNLPITPPKLQYYPEEKKVVNALFDHMNEPLSISTLAKIAGITMERSRGNPENATKAYVSLIRKRLEPQGYTIDIDPETQEVILSRTNNT